MGDAGPCIRGCVLVGFTAIGCADPPAVEPARSADWQTILAPVDVEATPVSRAGLTQPGVVRTLLAFAKVAAFGVFDSIPAEIFGKLEDVAMDSDDNAYVLDSHYKNVRVFSREGLLRQQGARAGQGPGELLNPLSIAPTEEGGVLVGELGHTIEVFQLSGDSLIYKDRLSIDVAARDLCSMGHEIVVHGLDLETNSLIHRYQAGNLDPVRFASFVETASPLVASELSKAKLLCSSDFTTFVLVPRSAIPEIRAYTNKGRLAWRVALTDYRPIEVTISGGGYSVRIPQGGFTRLFSLTEPLPGKVLVQTAFVTSEQARSGSGFAELHSFVFDLVTGVGGYIGDQIPPILAAGENCYSVLADAPFPRIGIRCRP